MNLIIKTLIILMYIKTKKRDWFSYEIAPWIVLYKIKTEENVKKSFLY